jgi:hypothetical protein
MSEPARTVSRARAEGAKNEWVFPSPRKKKSPISYYTVAKGLK